MFGGNWTTDKLKRLRKYLKAYTTIMTKQNFNEYMYIDAFAGTGWLTLKQNEESESQVQLSLLTSIIEPESRTALAGSARIALQIEPRFTKYIFVEKDQKRFQQLESIRGEFTDRNIILENSDANIFIKRICENQNWIAKRE